MEKYAKTVYSFLEMMVLKYGVKLFFKDLAFIINEYDRYKDKLQVKEALDHMRNIETVMDKSDSQLSGLN
jgi:hypothetical protein